MGTVSMLCVTGDGEYTRTWPRAIRKGGIEDYEMRLREEGQIGPYDELICDSREAEFWPTNKLYHGARPFQLRALDAECNGEFYIQSTRRDKHRPLTRNTQITLENYAASIFNLVGGRVEFRGVHRLRE